MLLLTAARASVRVTAPAGSPMGLALLLTHAGALPSQPPRLITPGEALGLSLIFTRT